MFINKLKKYQRNVPYRYHSIITHIDQIYRHGNNLYSIAWASCRRHVIEELIYKSYIRINSKLNTIFNSR